MTDFSKSICARCGQPYFSATGSEWNTICVHGGTAAFNIDPEHALRIQARYARGKLHNPDHDETVYLDDGFIPERARLTEP